MVYTKLLVLCAILGISLIVGCGNDPKDTIIPSNVEEWDALGEAARELPADEQQLLAAYLLRVKLGEVLSGEGIPQGFTIGDAISAQKDLIAEQDAEETKLQDLLQDARQEKKQLYADSRTKTESGESLVQIRYRGLDYVASMIDHVKLRVAVINNSEKTILGVRFRVAYFDIFDDEIDESTHKFQGRIEPGDTVGFADRVFMASSLNAAVQKNQDVTPVYLVEEVVFEDGSHIEF